MEGKVQCIQRIEEMLFHHCPRASHGVHWTTESHQITGICQETAETGIEVKDERIVEKYSKTSESSARV